MKHILSITVAAILIVVLSITVFAGEADDFSFESRTVRVGISPLPHFSEEDDEGELCGIIIDYLSEIKKYTGWNIEYVMTDATSAVEMLDNGEVDLMGCMIKNSQTSELYDFAEFSSGFAYSTITASKAHAEYVPNDFDTFKGIKVGVFNKAIARVSAFEKFCAENKLDVTPVYFDDSAEWEKAFLDGTVDAQLTSSIKLRDSEKIIANFQLEPYYFGVKKGNSDILRELNYALNQINQINPHYDANLYRKNFSQNNFEELFLTSKEESFVAEHPVLRVTAVPGRPPISSFDKNGVLRGISADIMKIIGEKTGFALEFVSAKDLVEALEILKSGKADILVGVSGEGLGSMTDGLLLSLPYLPIQTVLMHNVKNEITPTETSIMAVPVGFEQTAISDFVRLECATSIDAINAVKSKKADFTVVSNLIAENYIINNGKSGLTIVPMPNVDAHLSIAYSDPANPILLTLIDRAIYSISDAQLQAIIFQNAPMNGNLTFKNLVYSNPAQTITVLVLVGLTILSLILLVMQMRLRISRKNSIISDTYRIIGELSDEYILGYDFNTKLLSLPKRFAALLGLKELVSRKDCDDEGLIGLMDRFDSSATETSFSMDFRCVLSDKTKEMFRCVCMIVYDGGRKPERGIGKIFSIQGLIDEKNHLEKMLNTDSLTGLYSKHYCEQLTCETSESKDMLSRCALLLIDIDNFKDANDTLGHLGGDDVLMRFAKMLQATFNKGEILGRWGG
ncbi:MAG: transporter substrate-binding domain-containing protein, partial [Oscillospiraceae bacterium]